MADQRPEHSVDRAEFLRRTGALGLAGAAALGFPLLESRAAGAAPLPPARDVIAAGGGATIKIGHLDGFSGVYASASASQQYGMEAAVADAMKKNSRIKYQIVKGDDNSKPDVGGTEAKRLISQEKVDVLAGCLSSGVGLAVSSICEENGVFFLAIGTHDSNITGAKANKVTFRQTCSNAMLANAVGPALLKFGKKWYFLTADYAFGNDAHARLSKILLAQGGQEMGNDLHPLGQTDYSSYLTKARNSGADVLVLCNYGPDTQNATKAAVQLGLTKTMKFGGILCGNDVAVGMPVDDLIGSAWGYVWGPEAPEAGLTECRLAPVSRLPSGREHHQPPQRRRNDGHGKGRVGIRELPLRRGQGARSLLPLVRSSSGAEHLRGRDRRKIETAFTGRVLHDRLARRRRLRGRIVQHGRLPGGEQDLRLGDDQAARRLSDRQGLRPQRAAPQGPGRPGPFSGSGHLMK
jgi:branched-chain amino acid transport system substrate-binding protein